MYASVRKNLPVRITWSVCYSILLCFLCVSLIIVQEYNGYLQRSFLANTPSSPRLNYVTQSKNPGSQDSKSSLSIPRMPENDEIRCIIPACRYVAEQIIARLWKLASTHSSSRTEGKKKVSLSRSRPKRHPRRFQRNFWNSLPCIPRRDAECSRIHRQKTRFLWTRYSCRSAILPIPVPRFNPTPINRHSWTRGKKAQTPVARALCRRCGRSENRVDRMKRCFQSFSKPLINEHRPALTAALS